jgi:DNA-binding NtrC family response regulator
MRILVVEDERLLSEMLADVLTEQGFDVEVVAEAADALARLGRGQACDVLFTDINLGDGLDGVALSVAARRLRPGLPVVYCSGSVVSLREIGGVPDARFVAKPYDLNRVAQTLRAAVAALTPA